LEHFWGVAKFDPYVTLWPIVQGWCDQISIKTYFPSREILYLLIKVKNIKKSSFVFLLVGPILQILQVLIKSGS